MAQTTRTGTTVPATSLTSTTVITTYHAQRMRGGVRVFPVIPDYSSGFTDGSRRGFGSGMMYAIGSGYDDGFSDGVSLFPIPSGLILSASSDTVSPTVAVVSPTPGILPGQPGGFPADFAQAKSTAVVLRVTDVDPGVAYISVTVTYVLAGQTIVECAYRRGLFVGLYTNSKQLAISNGLQLSIVRTTGWPGTEFASSNLIFDVDALDKSGNLT